VKKMKLSVKLTGGFLLVAVIVLIVGFMGWNGVSNSLKATEKMSYNDNIGKNLLQREIDHLNWARKVGEFQRNENMTELNVEKDERKCAFGKWYYSEDCKKLGMEIPEVRELLQRIDEPHKKLHQSARELEGMLKKGKEFRKEAISYYGTETSSRLREVQTLLDEIVPKVVKHAEEAQNSARAQATQTKVVSLVGMAVGTLVAIALGVFLTISITRPINRVVAGLTEGAEQVTSGAGQVATAGQSLAEGASEQAAGLEETSSSLEEMASMTRQNADNAGQAKAMVSEAQQIVGDVNQRMKQMAESIGEITRSSEETGKIIKTIDEIAFQTNLLALNAAVEAARAGEAGAGFAVVADEVRNLAMRAAEAAKNTSSLIENTIKSVKRGNELTLETQGAFGRNVEIVDKIGKLTEEITAASQEQSQGVGQINKAVAEMDKVTQQNAASAEESAAAAEEMSAQAEEMRKFVKELKDLVGGGRNGEAASPGDSLGLLAKERAIKTSKAQNFVSRGQKILGVPKGKAGKGSEERGLSPAKVIPLSESEFKEL
jgi:uncharacterized phage infection (PIP) family protein YhgE